MAYEKRIKKALFTLNIDSYAPEIRRLTYPLMKHYCHKIKAEFCEITERKFPEWPCVYEKLQIYDLAQQMENDWNIYVDADAFINPDFFDITEYLPRNTVCHNGRDMAGNRWRYDRFFRRDGRHIGSCNWFAVASSECIELWKPLDDLTMQQAFSNIFPIVQEANSGYVTREHLIDDYTLSRNIAKYGLKCTTVLDVCKELGFNGGFLFHGFMQSDAEKVLGLEKMYDEMKIQRPPGVFERNRTVVDSTDSKTAAIKMLQAAGVPMQGAPAPEPVSAD